MNLVYLSLGSNVGDKILQIERAYTLLGEEGEVVKRSSFYKSDPWGFSSSNFFVNSCVEWRTLLSPIQCLKFVKQIEVELGRQLKDRAGYDDRTIDIDIIMFNELIISTPELTIPHPYYSERNFVLVPLQEIAPKLEDPISKVIVSTMKDKCRDIGQVHKIFA